jgi:hypothetical protein
MAAVADMPDEAFIPLSAALTPVAPNCLIAEHTNSPAAAANLGSPFEEPESHRLTKKSLP